MPLPLLATSFPGGLWAVLSALVWAVATVVSLVALLVGTTMLVMAWRRRRPGQACKAFRLGMWAAVAALLGLMLMVAFTAMDAGSDRKDFEGVVWGVSYLARFSLLGFFGCVLLHRMGRGKRGLGVTTTLLTEAQIKEVIHLATGITELMVTDMPVNTSADPIPRQFVIINVGPLPIDVEDAERGLEQTHAIIDAVLDSLVREPALLGCKIGISVFALPGGQAFRAIAAAHDVTAASKRPYELQGAYSNIRSFRALMGSD